MHLSFLHVFSWLNSSFPLRAEYYSSVWTEHGLFTHSPTEGQLGCFQALTVMNEAAVNIHEQAFVWTGVFSSPKFQTEPAVSYSIILTVCSLQGRPKESTPVVEVTLAAGMAGRRLPGERLEWRSEGMNCLYVFGK